MKAESVVGGNLSLVVAFGLSESVWRPYGVSLLIEGEWLYQMVNFVSMYLDWGTDCLPAAMLV